MNEARQKLKQLLDEHSDLDINLDKVAPELKEFEYSVDVVDTHFYKVWAEDEKDAMKKAKLGAGSFLRYQAGDWDNKTVKLNEKQI